MNKITALAVFPALAIVFSASSARSEPGPCQERDIKAKIACLNVWVDRIRNGQAAQQIPSGAIVAWRPPIESIDKANGTVKLPDGWTLCRVGASVTPSSVYLKGVTPKEYAESFDPHDPFGLNPGSKLYGGKPDHSHVVTIPGHAVDPRNDLTYGEGDRTHAANTIHGHSGGTSTESNDPPFAKVILLCAAEDPPIVAWSSYGYGGDKISVARKGVAFNEPINRSYAVCNAGPVAMAVAFRRPANSPATIVDEEKVDSGECLGVDRPSWLRVSSSTGKDVVFGTYYAMAAGTFPQDGVRFKNDATQLKRQETHGRRAIVGTKAREAIADCEKLPDRSPLRKDYYSACKIPLANRGNYRLCFPANFANQPNNYYAWGALRLILDSSFIEKGIPSIGPDLRSSVPQSSCIDLWDTSDAIVLVAPPSVVLPWNPELVKQVMVSIQQLDQ